MPNNYDPIARYYDRIHHLFYGHAEENAQIEMLDYVSAGDRLMIVGGGTGWILEKIAAIFPSGLEITYIESSARMMALTQARNWGDNKIAFFTGRVQEWRAAGAQGRPAFAEASAGGAVDAGSFDCILTGFFFDNFMEDHAREIVRKLTHYLKPGGYWLETDFYYPRRRGKLWQAILLWTMFVSARLICGVESKRLPDMERIMEEEGYEVESTGFHYQRFIRSMVYRKSADDRTYS